jgi:hypothetical protein
MTMRIKPLTLPIHGVIELLAGVVMIVAPALLGFSAGAIIVSGSLGAILAAAALGVTARRPTSVTAHTRFDGAFLLATALAALALALTEQLGAVLLLSAIILLLATLGFGTRYSPAQ